MSKKLDGIKDVRITFEEYFNKMDTEFTINTKVAFSSQTKWSGFNFKDYGTYIIGAPEFVLKNNFNMYKNKIEDYSKDYNLFYRIF